MTSCWFKTLPGAGECDGRHVKCHLIPKGASAIRGLLPDDKRAWVWGCGGPMGNAGHHGKFQPDGPRRIPRREIPQAVEDFAREQEIVWWLDRTYGER